MGTDVLIWLASPLLIILVMAALRAISGANQSRKVKTACIIVAVAILTIFVCLRYVVYPG